jgi:hypothetical protein
MFRFVSLFGLAFLTLAAVALASSPTTRTSTPLAGPFPETDASPKKEAPRPRARRAYPLEFSLN